MIDVSDGLVADLAHITQMRGGDDYELCFTAAPEFRPGVSEIASPTGLPLSRIGRITSDEGIRCIDAEGGLIKVNKGYQHFDVD
ncbi:MAG: hypothetical protein QGD92_06190 [Gammaproteobacteria bacterium]|nr:hypothetical protein [Gammaproteobacteria bacterium]